MTVRPQALALIKKINKEHGEGAVIIGSDMRPPRRFTSGSLSLDIALGGGWPGNQWIEVIGMESHGKTAVVLKTVAANQEADPDFTTLWIAAEHYDTDQATALGVDNDRVIVVPTQAMEHAYQTMLEFAASRAVDCVVLDSYPALIPDEEDRKDMDENVMAIGARLTGKFFRKAGTATRRSMTDDSDRPMLGLIINQYRDAIGQFSPHGTPKTTPGGKAKNFAFYTRVEVKRAEWIEEARPGKGKVKVGQVIKVQTIKNKSAAPQQVAAMDFYFRDAPHLGFRRGEYDEIKEVATYALLFDVVVRRGSTFRFAETVWKGKEAFLTALASEVDIFEAVRDAVLEASLHVDEIDEQALGAASDEVAEDAA